MYCSNNTSKALCAKICLFEEEAIQSVEFFVRSNPNTCTPTISLKGTPKSTHQKQISYKKLQIQRKNKENLRGKNPHLGLLPGKHSMNGRGERSGQRV